MVLLLLPLEMSKLKEWNNNMVEILGGGKSVNSWKTELLNILQGSEGVKGRDKAIEGGGSTRGYGITLIPKSLESIADQLTDRQLASRIIDHYESYMRKVPGMDFDNMPDAMKIAASDVMYNTGSLFNNFKNNLVNKDYTSALRDTLDIVSSNDEEAGNTKKILKGLANRRMNTYNEVAERMQVPKILSNLITPSKAEGMKTNITYNFAEGEPFSFDSDKGMHTKSISDEKPTGYDPLPQMQNQPMMDMPQPEAMKVFGSESLMYPGQDIEILGGLN